MSTTNSEQLADQYRAIAHMAKQIAKVYDQLVGCAASMPISVSGPKSARLLEMLGDAMNADDIVEAADAWVSPIIEKAHEMFPEAFKQPPETHPWKGALEGTILKMGERNEQLEREVWALRHNLSDANQQIACQPGKRMSKLSVSHYDECPVCGASTNAGPDRGHGNPKVADAAARDPGPASADLVSKLRHHADEGMFVTDSCAKLLREAADAVETIELKLDVERDLSQADRP